MELKRDEIKYVRDLAKSSYQKDKKCFICGKTEELQFHHFYSLTLLWEKWKRINKIQINSVDDILIERENFKGIFYREIYAHPCLERWIGFPVIVSGYGYDAVDIFLVERKHKQRWGKGKMLCMVENK